MGAAIEVADLAKAYGDLRAVDGVTFSVGEGEFFGILGPARGEAVPVGDDVSTPQES